QSPFQQAQCRECGPDPRGGPADLSLDRERARRHTPYAGPGRGWHHHQLSRTPSMMFDLIIVGGGAAGFYAAIQVAERAPHLRIAILERGKTVLSKVKVSGGGRCNVTHGEFSP